MIFTNFGTRSALSQQSCNRIRSNLANRFLPNKRQSIESPSQRKGIVGNWDKVDRRFGYRLHLEDL